MNEILDNIHLVGGAVRTYSLDTKINDSFANVDEKYNDNNKDGNEFVDAMNGNQDQKHGDYTL